MKKIFLSALAVCAIFAGCSKENTNVTEEINASPAKLSVVIKNPTVNTGTRAFDQTSATIIKGATIFVLDSKEVISHKIYIQESDLNVETIEYEVTTAAHKVVAVANKDLTSTAATTLFDLKKEVTQLEDLDVELNVFFASGTSNELIFDQISTIDATRMLATATVKLKLLPARLDVKVINEYPDYEAGRTTLLDVSVLNGGAFAHWVAKTENTFEFIPEISAIPTSQKYFRSGFSGFNGENVAQNQVYSELLKAWNNPAEEDFEETFYIYPIAENAYDQSTIIVIRSNYVMPEDGTIVTRYSSLYFHPDDLDVMIESGKKYIITVTVAQDTDIVEPIIPAFINVEVEIEDWIPVIINKNLSNTDN